MADKAIVTKIKALLAMAASTKNEFEAEAFFAKAYEMMEKHQLDSSDLDTDDPIGHEHTAKRKSAAAPDWDFRLMFAVARYFGCMAIQIDTFNDETFWKRDRKGNKMPYWKLEGCYMDLVGRESARITAIEMHKYLVTTVRRLGRQHAETETYERQTDGSRKLLTADTWSRRIGVALSDRLHSLAPKPERAKTAIARANALVTVDKVIALYDKLHPDSKTIKGPAPRTNSTAQDIAHGIGLNLQTGHDNVKRLA